jgi:hypothetical protein
MSCLLKWRLGTDRAERGRLGLGKIMNKNGERQHFLAEHLFPEELSASWVFDGYSCEI